MSTEARLRRLGLSHLANNPEALQTELARRKQEHRKLDAMLEAQLVQRLKARGITRQPG